MSRGPHAISADFVFDGDVLHRDTAVVVDDGRVAALAPRSELPAAVPVYAAPSGAWLAPGFIDLQVNGGGDVLFNDAPTPATIARMVAAHRRFGTTSLLPTLISDTPEQMRAALHAVAEIAATEPGVLGIHLEGPFLSPEKVGAHDPSMLRRPTADDVEMLTAAHSTKILVTLAPEQVPEGFIAKLAACGIRVADRSYDGDLRANQAAPCGKAPGASRISSMPCVRWAVASLVRSRRLWRRRTPGSE